MRSNWICSPLASSNSSVPQEQGALPTMSFAMIPLSELPAPILRPAFANHFRLRVELHAVMCLRVQVAKETFPPAAEGDRKSTRLNSSHLGIPYAVFSLK